MTNTCDISLATLQDVEEAIRLANRGVVQRISIEEINKKHGAIRDASRLQALVTIARKSTDKTLHLYGANNLENSLESLCSYAPALTAIRLNTIIKLGGMSVSRHKALQYAVDKMVNTDNQNYSQVVKGRVIDLCCISGAERQYLSQFFSTRDASAVKNSSAMSKSLTDILKFIAIDDFHKLDSELLRGFGVFTCELFKNTQEHARVDVNGMRLASHVEGMIASFVNLESFVLENDYDSNERLSEYFNSITEDKSGMEKIKCIQLSFFDTGPGITGRAFGKKFYEGNRSDEKNALLTCLKKNFTSKNQSGAGNGYPTILSQLKRIGGLIRIRSGRHCIFNCFEGDRFYNQSENSDNNDLMNFDCWTEDELELAVGTVVSILVPLRNESGQSLLF